MGNRTKAIRRPGACDMITTVRTLREGEAMPQHLGTGYEAMPVMTSFVWVAERDGHCIGILLAAPCHGLVFVVRVCVAPHAPSMTARTLLRAMMADCKVMGFIGYFSFIDPAKPKEAALMSICCRSGGTQIPISHVAVVGDMSKGKR